MILSSPPLFDPDPIVAAMDATGKREMPDSADGNAGDSKRRKETDSFQPVIRSKAKPCTRFFSTYGCPYGEDCHFLHCFPCGLQTEQRMLMPPARNPVAPPLLRDSAFGPALKSRICNKYNTAEGCKFGERCYFAHGQQELGKPVVSSSHAPIAASPSMGHLAPQGVRPTTICHAFATWKISVDASTVGIVIGEGGVNSEHICRLTGAKLSIRDHESDLSLKNIELEGTYGQIKQASAMVRDLIDNIAARTRLPARNPAPAT